MMIKPGFVNILQQLQRWQFCSFIGSSKNVGREK